MSDPVLRRWLVNRALGKVPGEPAFTAHHPPYLQGLLPLVPERPEPSQPFLDLVSADPASRIVLSLPGLSLKLEPGQEHDLFERSFGDTETLLAVHRFAWIPMLGERVDTAWVSAIWKVWLKHYQNPDDSWAWHPYTATERAVNLLRFARQYGLPEPRDKTLDCLAGHATAIVGKLEYFGDHHTSNHLANNGRGLFLLGLWLGLPKAADLGGRILIEEAGRIFHTSGMLREGSSHYHLLLTKNYADVASEADIHGRDEAIKLRKIADSARAVAAMLNLPGGLPLIGDISPDLPPQNLLEDLGIPPVNACHTWSEDGWLRYDDGPWSGLWHLSPQGWRQMPGHGHEDAGGFEIHFSDTPLFIDPGRGSYGKNGDIDCSGQAHNTLLVDGKDPYPPNRPYYDDRFRNQICEERPGLYHIDRGVNVTHHGYSRFKNIGAINRQWSFEKQSFLIHDTVKGSGTHKITRLLASPLVAELTDDGVVLCGGDIRFRISAPGSRVSFGPITRWLSFGNGLQVTQICFEEHAPLPWQGMITVEKD